jgi:guanylate kinase
MTAVPLIVLAGPSGVGKTTVAQALLAEPPIPMRRAVTATTRAPRPGEIDGRDYHFWTRDQFQAKIDNREMLEWAVIHGSDLYGTPLAEVCDRSQTVLLVIDVQGADAVRQLHLRHLSIFLDPPSLNELSSRLSKRGDAQDKIDKRLKTAETELTRAHEFHFRVQNDDFSQTITTIRGLIQNYRG